MPNKTSATGAAIKLRRENFADANAVIMWEANFHPTAITDVVYDSDRTQNWSGDEKQGRTCKVLGHIVGLEAAGTGRNDCMEDPAQYTNIKEEFDRPGR